MKRGALISFRDLNNPTYNEFMDIETQTITITDLLSHEIIENLKLDEKDLKILELFLIGLLENKESYKAAEVLARTEGKNLNAIRSYKRIIRLIQAGVLETVNLGSEQPLEILFTKVKLSNHFLSLCFEETPENEADVLPYKDNQEYLSDQCKRIELLYELNEGFSFKTNISSPVNLKEKRLAIFEENINKRLGKTDQTFPLEKLKKQKRLNKVDELAIIAVLRRAMQNAEYFEPHELLQLVEYYPFEKDKPKDFLTKGTLLKKRILEIHENNRSASSIIKLSEKIKKTLLDEGKTSLKYVNGFFEVISPSVPLDKVILHPDTYEAISLVCHKVKGGVSRKLKEWGVLNNKTLNRSATILFYGPPGTGKTMTAHAMASHLKKELLVFDCSKILGMWVGQSEKNTRMIFDEYRRISKGQRNTPVLLLNEADQFLHKRIEATRSTDHMYNQMQNIFLEQMENFNGVLIATTNLPDSMDSAFSRRFDHKIEFKRPGPEERFKLWQLHIPEKVPMDESVDIWGLAKQYDLSGGQISLIVRNAIARAAQNGDRLTQEDLIWACMAELAGNFADRSRVSIGF